MPGMLNPLLINLDECVGAKVQEVANQQAEKKSKKEIKVGIHNNEMFIKKHNLAKISGN